MLPMSILNCFDAILRNTIWASSSHIVIKMSNLTWGSLLHPYRELQEIQVLEILV